MPAPEQSPGTVTANLDLPAGHGFVVIDKPVGWTSFDVVARCRRLFGTRKVGHAGTLDPAATGVLPVAAGQGTRLLEYLSATDKTYEADLTFGVATDSHDQDGEISATADASHLTAEAVEAALAAWRGPVQQVPPMHAAIKVNGQRLYELARRGESIERASRPVTINQLTLDRWQAPVATVTVDCSKGTYIRSLARDLGDALGVGAHLSRLVRTRTGPFTLAQAFTLEQLAAADLPANWGRVAWPLDSVLLAWPRLQLDADQTRDWGHGKAVPGPAAVPGTRGRVYDCAGRFAGVATADSGPGVWRPAKVIESRA